MISILDYIPKDESTPESQAFEQSIALSQVADKEGIYSYLFGENHSTPSLLGTNSQLAATYALAKTTNIKIGTAGVMLDKRCPYFVAENYKMMAALNPNRVIAGVGISSMCEQDPTPFELPERENFDYHHNLLELNYYLENDFPDDYPGSHLKAFPLLYNQTIPFFVLVNSIENAKFVAQNGLGLMSGLFIESDFEHIQQLIHTYRENFVPSKIFPEPMIQLALYVVTAKVPSSINSLNRALDHWRIAFKENRRTAFEMIGVDDTLDYPFSSEEYDWLQKNSEAKVVGTPERVENQLKAIKSRLGLNGFIVINQLPGFKYRKELIELLAQMDL